MVREYFVKSFSAHGDMIEMDVFASGTNILQNLLAKRLDLLMRRRQEFNLVPSNTSINLKLLEKRFLADTAYLSYLVTETCSFSNSDDTSAEKSTCRHNLLMMLVKEEGEWKIKSFLSRDKHFGMFEKSSSARVLKVRNAIKTGVNLSPSLFTLSCSNDLIAKRYQQELDNIAKDKKASVLEESVPVSTGENRGLFDREAMRQYQQQWALSRNTKHYPDYSYSGGDCQNYVSQVIAAGGTPMDTVGSRQWYYFKDGRRSPSWAAVGYFISYILNNTGKGPHGVLVKNAGSLLSGDVVHIDTDYDGKYNHAVSLYLPGSSPTFSGHSNDDLNYPLYYIPGIKRYYHLVDYGK